MQLDRSFVSVHHMFCPMVWQYAQRCTGSKSTAARRKPAWVSLFTCYCHTCIANACQLCNATPKGALLSPCTGALPSCWCWCNMTVFILVRRQNDLCLVSRNYCVHCRPANFTVSSGSGPAANIIVADMEASRVSHVRLCLMGSSACTPAVKQLHVQFGHI